ncbi:phosphatase PAP2 family protein [Solirubrobacter phytolaccae]|uniref:Phosphatase PAP2 family protein n=1 Tax=Solirubrobacter phytolaccae TaxID=1404360 RepID=A0A9X3N845_9ACTN|nr:phosphatase PAP2 family protein [Solirubrobacter phytolaccae]MDA0181523.1 phosphatase PAP2 family protein [Solirubrobacter phytolaccae]
MKLLRDASLILAALALCPVVALLAPADAPLGRTRALADAERALGLFFEPAVHAWVAARPALLTAAGLFYVWVHLPATIGALVWVRLERPHAFAAARDTFLATQVLTVIGYLAFPVAPPRMAPELGFTDTLATIYGTGGEALAHTVQSPYAAMPSGHVAFAVVAAGTVFALVRSRVLRVGAVAYVLLVVAVIIGTANHFWLDAVGGAVAAALGFLTVRARTHPKLRRRDGRSRGDDGVGAREALTGGGDRGGPRRARAGAAPAGAGLRGDGARAAVRARRPGGATA